MSYRIECGKRHIQFAGWRVLKVYRASFLFVAIVVQSFFFFGSFMDNCSHFCELFYELITN